jgi:hypothetical protein
MVATLGLTTGLVSGGASAETSSARRPVLDVVTCPTQFGAGPETLPAPPARLPVGLPARVAKQLAFYSNGRITMLAPKGWSCDGLLAADGGEQLQAYPKGAAPKPGRAIAGPSVIVVADYTGHGPGAQLVCPYFPDSEAARFFGAEGPACPALPRGRTVVHETDDVATFRGPTGTVGEVIYPQNTGESPGGVPVTYAECTIRGVGKALCASVLDDVLTRRPPSTPVA